MSKAFDGARKKGEAAARAGLEESACPYPDKRTHYGRFTWSRVFRSEWLGGFRSVEKARNVAPPEKAAEKKQRGGNVKGERKGKEKNTAPGGKGEGGAEAPAEPVEAPAGGPGRGRPVSR